MVYTAAGPHTPGLLSGSRYAALASVSSSSSPPSTTTCTFCSKPGHVELACELYLAAQSAAREQTKKQCKKRRRKKTKAKVAASPIADMVKGFAGNIERTEQLNLRTLACVQWDECFITIMYIYIDTTYLCPVG